MTDTIVVGGGIVGASTAYHLARDGADVLLIDRRDEGRATDAGAGILSPATSSREADDAWFRFAVDAVSYYPELVERLRGDGAEETSYATTGALTVAADEGEVSPFEAAGARIEARREWLDRPVEGSLFDVDAEEARERFPPLAETRRARFYEDAARVDARVFTDALLRAGRERGLTVERASVETIRVEGGAVRGVETADGARHDAPTVVVAGGAWSGAFGDQLGITLPVEPKRGQIAHLSVDADTADWPIVSAFRGHYIVPWPDGRVAVGATRETGSGFAPRATAGGVREVLAEALRVAPGLADAELAEVRVGLRPTTPDGSPVLGPVPGVEGAFLATGHGPTGLQLGPYSGRVVAEAVRGRESGIPPAFRPDRFD